MSEVLRHAEQCVWSATDGGAQQDAVTASVVYADVPLPVHLETGIARPQTYLRHTARLPMRIGTRMCGVHEGELAALLACISRAPAAAIQVVVDRDALIYLVDQLPERSIRDTVRGNFPPWESRLRHLLQRREQEQSAAHTPLLVPIPPGQNAWRCSTAYRRTQLVWVPSHQPDGNAPRVPNEFCASLNHWADIGAARLQPEQSRTRSTSRPAGHVSSWSTWARLSLGTRLRTCACGMSRLQPIAYKNWQVLA